MNKSFHLALYNGYDYGSILELKLIHVSKRGRVDTNDTRTFHLASSYHKTYHYRNSKLYIVYKMSHQQSIPVTLVVESTNTYLTTHAEYTNTEKNNENLQK